MQIFELSRMDQLLVTHKRNPVLWKYSWWISLSSGKYCTADFVEAARKVLMLGDGISSFNVLAQYMYFWCISDWCWVKTCFINLLNDSMPKSQRRVFTWRIPLIAQCERHQVLVVSSLLFWLLAIKDLLFKFFLPSWWMWRPPGEGLAFLSYLLYFP